jgi:NAD(P)-dependent dehydrogenase (short-subunit alcohol dehydrogenase family)
MTATNLPRSAVITGASSGIGRACALRLDGEGFSVFAGVRRHEDGERLRAEASSRLTPVILDVTQELSLEATAKTVSGAVGDAGLGGLVNNAGLSLPAIQEFIDLDEVRRLLEVNLIGVMATTKALLPLIRRARGRIVNIGSLGGYNAAPFLGPYAASKFALEGISDALRRELWPWGLQVSLVEPGSVATPIWDKALGQSEELQRNAPEPARELYLESVEKMTRYAETLAQRGISPKKVADAVQHALTARRPRTRYRVGVDAKLFRFLTRVLPDRVMDAFVLRTIGISRAK